MPLNLNASDEQLRAEAEAEAKHDAWDERLFWGATILVGALVLVGPPAYIVYGVYREGIDFLASSPHLLVALFLSVVASLARAAVWRTMRSAGRR